MVARGGRAGSGPAQIYRRELGSPIGELTLYGTERGLLALALPRHSREGIESWIERVTSSGLLLTDDGVLNDAAGQIEAFLAGTRRGFDLALDIRGTAFQRAVWDAVARVPYGGTSTYAKVACAIGRPLAVRAVGAANGANPLPIVIPCHRITGSNGSLTGYGGGLDLKARLLALEGAPPLAH
ncbi:MAG: methylated-DNA--[protein]-cysteine S-methyltransferase [Chloroflexi bacterium]|nr:methylated-DNA--[protein]-cysteine S-methyltransferase [Chloroflexota bacterium]